MRIPVFGRPAKVAIAVSGLLLSTSLAFAAGANFSPAVSTATTANGHAVKQVKIVRDAATVSTSSTTFVAIPGAQTNITIPANTKGLIIARFSATSVCTDSGGNTTGGYGCSVRIMIGGQEAEPAVGGYSLFDSTGISGRQAHEIERSRGPLNPGTYSVVVQFMVPTATVELTLKPWNLEVDLVKI